jgi:hypothetical protein
MFQLRIACTQWVERDVLISMDLYTFSFHCLVVQTLTYLLHKYLKNNDEQEIKNTTSEKISSHLTVKAI